MVVAFLMKSPFYKERGVNMQCGNYNGYVAFKEELPLSYQGEWNYNTETEEHLDDIVDVHGGITYDIKGFGEATPIIPITEIPEDFCSYRVIGFDCAHSGDTSEIWSFEATKKETLNLKKQIETLIKNIKII